jgi:hypothetical protein
MRRITESHPKDSWLTVSAGPIQASGPGGICWCPNDASGPSDRSRSPLSDLIAEEQIRPGRSRQHRWWGDGETREYGGCHTPLWEVSCYATAQIEDLLRCRKVAGGRGQSRRRRRGAIRLLGTNMGQRGRHANRQESRRYTRRSALTLFQPDEGAVSGVMRPS